VGKALSRENEGRHHPGGRAGGVTLAGRERRSGAGTRPSRCARARQRPRPLARTRRPRAANLIKASVAPRCRRAVNCTRWTCWVPVAGSRCGPLCPAGAAAMRRRNLPGRPPQTIALPRHRPLLFD